MRKWHRWLSVLFGLLILFVAVTGVLSQIGSLVNNNGFEDDDRERPAPAPATPAPASTAPRQATAASASALAFACPATMTCRPKRVARPGEWDVGFLHHIHSGEQFGPAGVILSLASGLALIFFAFSGLYMYIQMFRRRSHRKSHPTQVFWP